MSKEALSNELQGLKRHFQGRGLCKVISLGDECRCPLCVIDDATAFLERVKSAFERGMMTRELAEYLIEPEDN